MRTALAIAVALLAAAPPAGAAETLGRSAVTAGPVLAGGSVLWADAPSGRPRVLAGGPGRRPVVRARWPRATAKDTGRTVAALAGSADRVAAVVETCTTEVDGDAVFLGCTERAFGGPRFSPLGGPMPRRGLRGCPGPRTPVSVAAGDGVSAVAETRSCQGIARTAATRSRVVLRRAGERWTVASSGASDVRIAGRYLAFVEGGRIGERAVVYDLRRRTVVRRLAAEGIESLDVQRDGTLALLVFNGATTCAFLASPRSDELRRLECDVSSRHVALSGGRALYVRDRALRLAGAGEPRTLARAGRGKEIGGFDLGPRRAVWSVGELSGRHRIMLQRL